MSDTFTSNRMVWLEAAHNDALISPVEFEVAFGIAMHLNRKSGEAWPSLALLARKVGVSERTIYAAIQKLIVHGYLAKRRAGRGKSNRYRLLLTTDDRKPTSDHNGFRSEAHFRSNSTDDRKLDARMIGSPLPTNPLMNPLKAETGGRLATRQSSFPPVSAEPYEGHRSLQIPVVAAGTDAPGDAPSGAPSASFPSTARAEKKKLTPRQLQKRKLEFDGLVADGLVTPKHDTPERRARFLAERANGTSVEEIRSRLVSWWDHREAEKPQPKRRRKSPS